MASHIISNGRSCDAKEPKEVEECCICFGEKECPVVLPQCKHEFCFDCLKGLRTCPLCRGHVPEISMLAVNHALDLFEENYSSDQGIKSALRHADCVLEKLPYAVNLILAKATALHDTGRINEALHMIEHDYPHALSKHKVAREKLEVVESMEYGLKKLPFLKELIEEMLWKGIDLHLDIERAKAIGCLALSEMYFDVSRKLLKVIKRVNSLYDDGANILQLAKEFSEVVKKHNEKESAIKRILFGMELGNEAIKIQLKNISELMRDVQRGIEITETKLGMETGENL